jgi:hypothetical protein
MVLPFVPHRSDGGEVADPYRPGEAEEAGRADGRPGNSAEFR